MKRQELKETKNLNQYSPLYCRLNGFMSGAALLVAALSDGDLYDYRSARINSFLKEVQIPLQLPSEQAELKPLLLKTASVITDQLKLLAEELGDFHALAFFMLTLPEDESNLDPKIAKELERIKNQYDLPEEAFEEFQRARNQARKVGGIAVLLNIAVALLRRLIALVEMEAETCFVSMPFLDTFEFRWASFYWPLVSLVDMRAIRAWGDIAGEDYQALMWTTIDKCGALIADASNNGPNVLSEVGYAMGAKKLVMVMRADDSDVPVANIHPDWIYKYKTDADLDWTDPAIEQALYWYGAVKAAHENNISFMDSNSSPGNMLDYLNKAAKNMGKSFFTWKGRSDESDKGQ